MFYISMSGRAMEGIRKEAKQNPDTEIIGVLIGEVSGDVLVVNKAVTGEFEPETARVTLPSRTIAKVSDKILKGEIKGNIVGWYHSHPGYGVFMSETDIESQRRLQQFSSEVVALVIDPTTDEVGFFTLDPRGNICTIDGEFVHFYGEGEPKIPQKFLELSSGEELIPVHPRPHEEYVLGEEPRLPLPPIIVHKDTKTLKIAIVALAVVGVIASGILYGALTNEFRIANLDDQIQELRGEIGRSQELGIPVENAQEELNVARTALDEQNVEKTREYIERASIQLQMSTVEWKIEEIPEDYDADKGIANSHLDKVKKKFPTDKYPYEDTTEDLEYAMKFVDARLLTITAGYYVKQVEPLIGDLSTIRQNTESATRAFDTAEYTSAIDQANEALERIMGELLPVVEDNVDEATREWLDFTIPREALQRVLMWKEKGEYKKAIQETLYAELELQIILGEWMKNKAEDNVGVEPVKLEAGSSSLVQAKKGSNLVLTSTKGDFAETYNIIKKAQENIMEETISIFETRFSDYYKDLHIDISKPSELFESVKTETNLQEKMESILIANASFEIQLAYRCTEIAEEVFEVADMQDVVASIQGAEESFDHDKYSEDTNIVLEKAKNAQKSSLQAALIQLLNEVDAAEKEGKNVQEIRDFLDQVWSHLNSDYHPRSYLAVLKLLLKAKEELDALIS